MRDEKARSSAMFFASWKGAADGHSEQDNPSIYNAMRCTDRRSACGVCDEHG